MQTATCLLHLVGMVVVVVGRGGGVSEEGVGRGGDGGDTMS